MLGIEEPYLAYCLDEAVGHFGSHVEAAMDAVKPPKGKKARDSDLRGQKENVLRKYLGLTPKFRSITDLTNPKG